MTGDASAVYRQSFVDALARAHRPVLRLRLPRVWACLRRCACGRELQPSGHCAGVDNAMAALTAASQPAARETRR